MPYIRKATLVSPALLAVAVVSNLHSGSDPRARSRPVLVNVPIGTQIVYLDVHRFLANTSKDPAHQWLLNEGGTVTRVASNSVEAPIPSPDGKQLLWPGEFRRVTDDLGGHQTLNLGPLDYGRFTYSLWIDNRELILTNGYESTVVDTRVGKRISDFDMFEWHGKVPATEWAYSRTLGFALRMLHSTPAGNNLVETASRIRHVSPNSVTGSSVDGVSRRVAWIEVQKYGGNFLDRVIAVLGHMPVDRLGTIKWSRLDQPREIVCGEIRLTRNQELADIQLVPGGKSLVFSVSDGTTKSFFRLSIAD